MTARTPDPHADIAHNDVEEKFSEYYEGALPDNERGAVAAHLAQCERCQVAYDEFKGTVTALADLHKMSAPPQFDSGVADTIRRRSRGRFFGRRSLGDRIPFEILAIVVLILGLLAFALLRSSPTGSLRYQDEPEQPSIAPGAKDVVPQPAPLEP